MVLNDISVKRYLLKLGIACREVRDIDLRKKLPLTYASACTAKLVEIQDRKYILAILVRREIEPDAVSALYYLIKDSFGVEVIVGLDSSDFQFCRFLQEKSVNYVVPGRQVHIQPRIVLASDRAYSNRPVSSLRLRLSSRAQQVLLLHFNHNRGSLNLPYQTISEFLELSPAEISLAATELRRQGLCEISRQGVRASVEFRFEGIELWRRAQPLMFNPCRRVVRSKFVPPNAIESGLTALAKKSDIVYREPHCYALYDTDENRIPAEEITSFMGARIEYWRYDPRRFSKEGGGRRCVFALSCAARFCGCPCEEGDHGNGGR